MKLTDFDISERAIIRRCFLFKGVSTWILHRALGDKRSQLRWYAKGSLIAERALGLILAGSVLVQSPSGSHKLTLRTFGPGDVFGATALFTMGGSYATRLTALTECRILFFSQELLQVLMREDVVVAENYIRFLSDRIRFLNRKIACLAASSIEEMLALRLLETRGKTMPVPSFSRLAEELGIGRASLYRVLDKFVDDGLIARKPHGIEILNVDGLEKIVK